MPPLEFVLNHQSSRGASVFIKKKGLVFPSPFMRGSIDLCLHKKLYDAVIQVVINRIALKMIGASIIKVVVIWVTFKFRGAFK